jgi:hypothetical protein
MGRTVPMGQGTTTFQHQLWSDDLAEFRTRRRASLAGLSSRSEVRTSSSKRYGGRTSNLGAELSDMERDYVKLTRLNEIYREELIDHRRRVRSPGLLSGYHVYSTIPATDGDVGRQPDWDFECRTRLPFTTQTVNVQCHIRISHCWVHTRPNPAAHLQRTDSTTLIAEYTDR